MTNPASPAPEATNFQAPSVTPTPSPNPSDSEVVLEVDGRKYTRNDLVKKIVNQDSFIQQLTAERAEDRKLLTDAAEALKKATGSKEILDALNQRPAPTPAAAAPQAPAAPAIDPEAIAQAAAAKVTTHLQNQSVAAARETNWNQVTASLTAVYGEQTNATVAKIAAENDMTVDEAAELARSKPKAFLKLFPELSQPRASGRTTFNSTTNPQALNAAPSKRVSSGFGKATSDRDRVAIYTKRLQEKLSS